jgi:hypothetical protein
VFDYDFLIEKNYDRDYRRWVRRCNYPKFQASFDKWASQVHFLYGCGWAIMFGTIIGRYLSDADDGYRTFWFLLIVSILCLIGALVQDYALYYYDHKLMTDFHSQLPAHKTRPKDDVT